MSSKTFAQLSLAVQQNGAWENSGDITPDVLLTAINYGLRKGFDTMVEKWQDYYTLDTTFAIVANTATYLLTTIAPNFYKLRHLDVSADGVRFQRIYPYDLTTQWRYSQLPVTAINRIRYRMQGPNLILSQPPPAGTGKIYWIPQPVQFASIADVTPVTFDVPAEEELVVHLAEKFCLKRSELDLTAIDKQIAEDTADLRSAGDNRDAGEPFSLDPNGPPSRIWYGDEGDGYY